MPVEDDRSLVALLRDEVAELRARVEIQELFARYGFFADSGAVDAWLDLFCDDAWMDVPDYSTPGANGYVRLEGRNELREQIVDNPKVAALRGRAQHYLLGPHTVTIEADTAEVDSYGYVLVLPGSGSAGAPTPSPSYNHWTLRRTAGRWLIQGCVRRPVSAAVSILAALS